MKKSLLKRVLALVLCLALSAGYLPVPIFAEEAQEPVALQQEEPVEEPEEEAQETQAPTTEPNTEPTEESTEAAVETTEETTEVPAEELPQEEPDLDQAVATLQALIDALPEEVTEDNAEIVAAQLETILEGVEALAEDQIAQLDLTRYESALAALDALTGGLYEADTLDGDTEVEVRRDDDSQKYDTLEEAIAVINALPSGLNFTVVLLSNVTLEDTLDINHCTITLDTNGKHITGTLNIGDQGSLTLTGEGTVDEIQIESANYNSAELKVTGGKVGSLYYDGGYPISVKLSGGSYSKIGLGQYAGNRGMTVRELLDSNYAFRIDGSLYRWKTITSLTVEGSDYGITVVPCSHDYRFESYLGEKPGICVYCAAQCQHPSHDTDGKCTTCGVDCSHSFDSKTGACTVCGKVCAHQWNENGQCTAECKMQAVASVSKTGAETQYYADLQGAFDAVETCTAADNATVTLLRDIVLTKSLTVSGGVFTLDVESGIFVKGISISGGEVTLTGKGSFQHSAGITITGGTLNIADTCEVSVVEGVIEVKENGKLNIAGGIVHVWFEGNGTLNITGGVVGILSVSGGNVTLSGGSYGEVYAGNLASLLAKGYAYQKVDNDGNVIGKVALSSLENKNSLEESDYNFQVVRCTDHNYDSATGTCEYCLVSAVASVTDSNQKVRYYGTWEDAFLFSMDGETLTLLADWEDEVTVSVDGARTLDLGGHTLKSLKSTGSLTLTVQGEGSLECITLELGKTKLLGGPFRKVVLSNITDPKDIDVAKLTPEGIRFLHTANYKDVTADDFKAGTEGCTLTGPVEGHIVHTFDQDTGLCPCGEQAEAKVNSTVYKTFEEALEALNSSTQSDSYLYLLKDVDLSEKTLSIKRAKTWIYWKSHTLTVHELTIDASYIRMLDETGTGGVKGTVRMGECYQLQIHNGTYSGLTVRNGCTIYGGTYGVLTAKTDCDSVTINGGTFSRMDLFGANQIITPSGKMFYKTTNGQVWTKSPSVQEFDLTLKDHDPHTPDETTGKCICGLSFAASVTAGETTAYYGTLQAAITEAAKTSGSTVKLFTNGANVSISSGTSTLNWNGYTVTQLTVTGGTLTLTGGGGVSGTGEKALDIQGGTVDIQSGSYHNVYVGENASITFAGGEIKGTDGKFPVTIDDASRFQVPAGKVLYSSYYPKIRPYTYFTEGETLTVKDCSEHDASYANPDVCEYCATELVAKITDETYQTEYYTDFKTALSAAQGKAGSTLTLLRDTASYGNVSFGGTFTIDWNGHIWHASPYITGGHITMRNEKERGGISGEYDSITLRNTGTLTIEGGSYVPIETVMLPTWTLEIRGGTFTGWGNNPPLPKDSGVTVNVDTGYVFYDQTGAVVSDWKTKGFAAGSTVTLKYHENHTPDDTGKCVCGLSGAAVLKVTDYQGNFTETPYNDFSALRDAETANNTDVRLTLWVDICLDTAETIGSDSYAFTLDWNGKKVLGSGSFTIDSTTPITLTDSQGGGGLEVPLTINGKVTLEGGRYMAPITLGDNAELTLPLEKAFHNESDGVIPQAEALAKTEGYVSVATHDHKTSGCNCGRGVAAIVTLNGQDTPYSTLSEAFANIQSGCTLKLLSDGTLESDPGTWDFTLDLGGCTLITYTDEYSYDPAPGYGQTLTIQDSVGNGVLKTQKGISLDNSGSVALEGGTVEGNIDGGSGYSTITISGGTVTGSVIPNMGFLTITGGRIGTLEQGYSMTTRTLHGGTFGKLEGCDRYMLEEGWALHDAEGNVVNIGGADIQDVTVKAHTHDFSKGSCPCGGITSGEGKDIPYEQLAILAGESYQVNGDEVQLQSRTWNNQTYLSREDGKPLKNAIIQTYTWGENSMQESYPTGMTVYRVVENEDHVLELRQETALTNLLIYRGASVRCTEPSGIRIITGMTKENKEALKGSGLDGFTLVQAGTVAAWTEEMGYDSCVTLEKSFKRYGAAYVKGVRDNVFKDLDNEIQYTNVLINFPDSKLGNSLVLRSYAILEKDGVQYTVYGGQVTRSIRGIATQILSDGNISLTATERSYLAGLLADTD